MDYISSFIYGVIQGITEFIPVSSSGHLALLPELMKIPDPGVVFDLSMHVGTSIAVILYFWRDVAALLVASWKLVFNRNGEYEKKYFALNMIVSTVATVIVAVLFKPIAFAYGRSTLFICINLALFGVLMFFSDRKGDETKVDMVGTFVPKKALWIGVCQAFAIFPGVSRSGATLTISRYMGLSRLEATRYSFLLSLPIIFGGFIGQIPELINNGGAFGILPCLWGMTISFIVGLFTIHFFLKFIAKIGLGPFALYRVILAIVIAAVFI